MAPPLILIVEDHPDIVEIIRYNLAREGFGIEVATDGADGLAKAVTLKPSLVLLDIMLPKVNGLGVCRALRSEKNTKDLAIVMLTAKGSEEDIVKGLELGADDYIVKPFSPKELVARIRSVLRRSKSKTDSSNVIRIRDLVIDGERHEVMLQGKSLTLTLAEFRILQAMAAYPGRVFTRDQLVNKMTGGDVAIIDRNVDVHISALRKKLLQYGELIATVRGVGYRFTE